MLLLSSAKVALTNMGPRAKPKLFSVSLTQNFHRGRQVWKHKGEGLLGSVLLPDPCWSGRKQQQLGPVLPSRTSGRLF